MAEKEKKEQDGTVVDFADILDDGSSEDSPKKEKKELKELRKRVNELEKQSDDWKQKYEDATKSMDEWKNKYYSVYSDMANTRKQIARENEDFKKYAKQSVIEEFIPVLDAFDAALKNEPADENVRKYLEGFRMIHSKLLQALEQLNVTIIDPKVGDTYDPHTMEALMVIDGKEDEKVADTFRKGYKLYDHLIRAATVVITRKADEPAENQEENTIEIKEADKAAE